MSVLAKYRKTIQSRYFIAKPLQAFIIKSKL
jgi:hypothetical protein